MKILALGDCNTLGIEQCRCHSFPELLSEQLGAAVDNVGHTMATTREGVRLFDQYYQDHDVILISFGLTDSWQGFKYSPYVLYYPNNFLRKIARKLVKKWKKWARKLGLDRYFGKTHVTSPQLYLHNIRYILDKTKNKQVFLLDTLPKQQEDRNVDIVYYNQLLDQVSKEYEHVARVRYFDYFHARRDTLFIDKTHLNELGCKYVAQEILNVWSPK